MKTITLLLLIFTNILIGQNCKYKIDKVDEFTKSKILVTKDQSLSRSFYFYSSITGKKVNDSRFLVLNLEHTSIYSISKNNKVMFLTEDGNVIEFYSLENKIANSKYNSSTKLTTWRTSLTFPIDLESLTNLTSQKIIKLRVYTDEGTIDSDVKEKWWKKCLTTLKCIE